MTKTTINSRKFDGSLHKTWQCELLAQQNSLLVFRGEFDQDIKHEHLGLIERGTISYEFFWLERWFNVFRFHHPDSTLRNFYCNITMPPKFENGVLDYVDLDIDIIVWPDFRYEMHDRDDFEKSAYPDEIKTTALKSLNEVMRLIEERTFPGAAAID